MLDDGPNEPPGIANDCTLVSAISVGDIRDTIGVSGNDWITDYSDVDATMTCCAAATETDDCQTATKVFVSEF